MQKSFLKILPGAENIGARLALLVLGCLLVALVLGLLALLEIAHLSPVELEGEALFWVILGFALTLMVISIILWLAIDHDVLRPLEQIRALVHEEEQQSTLGSVAATMQGMRDSIARTQAELDESHKNLRQVEKLAIVGKLAAGVAHSVRNPLTSVNLRLFSLARGLELSPNQQEDFDVIAGAVRHIDTVLTNFLEFSRRPKLNPCTVDIASVVDSTLKLLENKLASFPVKLTRHPKGTSPTKIYGDPDQLQEALLNIILNSCEAMEYKGSIDLVEYVDTIDGELFVHVSVHDTGPGVAPDLIREIFVPFFSTKEQGTGLGLPIAKSILEEHGGDILVSSSLGVGTKFILIVPAYTL